MRNWRGQIGNATNSTLSKDMLQWMKWLYSIEQPHRSLSHAESLAGLKKIYDVLSPSPNTPRTKALVILANIEGFSITQIAKHLAITRKTVRGYLAEFQSNGEEGLFNGKTRSRKSQDPELKKTFLPFYMNRRLYTDSTELHGE